MTTLHPPRINPRREKIADDHWQEQAQCRNASDEYVSKYFFATTSEAAQEQAIRDYCWHCPVLRECVEWVKSDDNKQRTPGSIWGAAGGMTQAQRRARKRGAK